MIDYDHRKNLHTIAGASTALPYIFDDIRPRNLLDVGCGTGTWIRAALEHGISDVYGVDGVALNDDELLFPKRFFQEQDLARKWSLGRKFDVALCLEVAEHLPAESAAVLIQSLVAHSDIVVFSGACPGQIGQHHVNCQWPQYWQQLFNTEGYVCDDAVRWRIWDIEAIEPWYRQNILVARRNIETAGKEQKIRPVIHPQMLGFLKHSNDVEMIEAGYWSTRWYLSLPMRAGVAKVKRKLMGGSS